MATHHELLDALESAVHNHWQSIQTAADVPEAFGVGYEHEYFNDTIGDLDRARMFAGTAEGKVQIHAHRKAWRVPLYESAGKVSEAAKALHTATWPNTLTDSVKLAIDMARVWASGSVDAVYREPQERPVGNDTLDPIERKHYETLNRVKIIRDDLGERSGGENDAKGYKPPSAYPVTVADRIRKAAQPSRKTKRVRTKTVDGVKLYCDADIRQWWPNDLPSESA